MMVLQEPSTADGTPAGATPAPCRGSCRGEGGDRAAATGIPVRLHGDKA